jgi:hypothetical protein
MEVHNIDRTNLLCNNNNKKTAEKPKQNNPCQVSGQHNILGRLVYSFWFSYLGRNVYMKREGV